MKSLAYVIGLLGLWLALSTLVFSLSPEATVSNVIGGLLIVLLSGIYSAHDAARSVGLVIGLIGLWLAASTLVFGFPTDAAVSNIIGGLLIVLMACVDSVRDR